MSRPGNPWDNAWAESFIKTLKVEEINGQRYRNFHQAETGMGMFIEEVYNQQRMHSALDYYSPIEFESKRPVETAAAEEINKGRFAASTL